MKYLKNITLLLFTLYTINAFSSNMTFIVKPSVSIELQDDWEEIFLDNPGSKKTYVKKDDSGELIGIVDIVSKLNFTSFDTSIWNIESDTEFIQRVNKYSQTYDILNSSIEKIAVNSFQFLKTKIKMRKHSTNKVETHYTYPCFLREGSKSYILTLIFIELDETAKLETEFNEILKSFERKKDYIIEREIDNVDIQIPIFKEYSVHKESSLAKYTKEQIIDAFGMGNSYDNQNIEVLYT